MEIPHDHRRWHPRVVTEPDEVRRALAEAAEDLPDLYRDPVQYDLLAQMTAPADLELYRALAEEHPGPILELGSGTGRVALELAEAGHDVTGVELVEPMVEMARQKAEQRELGVTLGLGDLRSFALGRTFGLVLVTYNTFNHLLDLDSIRRALAAIAHHMDASSRLVIDTFQPSLEFLGADHSTPEPILRYLDPYVQEEVVLSEENHYDPATQVNRVVWRFAVGEQRDARVDEMRMRIFFPQELDAHLTHAGFRIEHKWGDYDRKPFASDTPKQLTVCRLA